MNSNVVILTDPESPDGFKWETIGQVVTELSELYQLVKEQQLDLMLYDSDRMEITRAVAMKLHRHNDLMDIRAIVADEMLVEGVDDSVDGSVIDGTISGSLTQDQMVKQITQILADKKLLSRYGMIGRSSKIRVVARTIDRIAPTEVPVLIVGPSGSGKELVAKAVHTDSARSDRPFVAINCGALAEGVLESELFGHEKGAFTGSVGRRDGLFQKADQGTLFLDELGEMSLSTQVKLLRILEDGTYYPVGSSTPKRANVRIVAATNRDLAEAIADKRFREDLYFRLSVVKVVLPSLFERRLDIQPLLNHFFARKTKLAYTDSALEMLMNYDWPGNVRQLKNFAERMMALKQSGLIDNDDVSRFLAEQHAGATHLPVSTGATVEEAGHELMYRAILSLGNEVRLLRDLITSHLPVESGDSEASGEVSSDSTGGTVDDMERQLIIATLDETGGNRKEAARRLGIGERTLYRKLNKYSLS